MFFLGKLVLKLIHFIYFAQNTRPCHEVKTMDNLTIKIKIEKTRRRILSPSLNNSFCEATIHKYSKQ
jgi:hypothetical protein